MEAWLPLGLFAVVMGALMIVLSRYQASRYQTYLSQHTEQTTKMTKGQRELIEQHERQISIAERQVAALERIAAALEHKSS